MNTLRRLGLLSCLVWLLLFSGCATPPELSSRYDRAPVSQTDRTWGDMAMGLLLEFLYGLGRAGFSFKP